MSFSVFYFPSFSQQRINTNSFIIVLNARKMRNDARHNYESCYYLDMHYRDNMLIKLPNLAFYYKANPLMKGYPSFYRTKHLFALLCLTSFALSATPPPPCVSTRFPVGLGDADAYSGGSSTTQYDVIDYDSSLNLAIGGFTTSSNLCPGALPQHPLVEFISSAGTFVWYKCVNPGATAVASFYTTVAAIQFSNDKSQILAVLDKPSASTPLVIVYIQSSDGTIVNQYQESVPASPTGNSKIYPRSLTQDSSDQIYIGLTLYNRWTYIKLKTKGLSSPTITSSFHLQQSQDHADCGNAYAVSSASKYRFITGQIRNGGDCYTGAVVMINQDGPTYEWLSAKKVALADLPSKGSIVFTKVQRQTVSNSNDYMWMCGYQKDSTSTQAYFQRIRVDENNGFNLDASNILYMKYNDQGSTTLAKNSQCIGYSFDSSPSNLYALVADYSNGMLEMNLVQFMSGSDFGSLTTKYYKFENRFKYSSGLASTAVTLGDGTLYIVGSLKQYLADDLVTVNGKTWAHGFVFQETISTSSLTGNCINLAAKSITNIMVIQGGNSVQDRYAEESTSKLNQFMTSLQWNNPQKTYSQSTLLSVTDIAATLVDNRLTCGVKTLTVQGSTVASPLTKDLYVDQNSLNQPLTFSVFYDSGLTTECSSAVTVTLDTLPIEPTITYDSNAGKVLFTTSTPALNAYTITVTGTLATGETGVVAFDLVLTNDCLTAILTEPSPLTTYPILPYIITQSQQKYPITLFTTSDPRCVPTYSATMGDGTALTPSSLLSFDTNNKRVQIGQASDNNYVGTYSIKIVATINSVPPVILASSSISIDVLHQCSWTNINNPNPTSYDYIIEKALIQPANVDLVWTQNITSCPIIEYEATTPISAVDPTLVTLNITGYSNQAKFVITTTDPLTVGTYTMGITGRVWKPDRSILYRDKVVTYNFRFLSCTATIITTKGIQQSSPYKYYITDNAKTFTTQKWSEKLANTYTNQCGTFSYTFAYSPAGSEAGVVTASEGGSNLNFVVQTSDLSKAATISVTVSGTTSLGGVVQTYTFSIQVLDPCLYVTITVNQKANDQVIKLPVTLYPVTISTYSSTRPNSVCGQWNYMTSVIKDGGGNSLAIGDPNNPFAWDATYGALTATGAAGIFATLSPYTIDLYAYQGTYSTQNVKKSTFKVTFLSGGCLVSTLVPNPLDLEVGSDSNMAPKEYTIGASTMNIPINAFVQTESCNYAVTYTLSVQGESTIPGFITSTFQPLGGSISISTKSRADAAKKTLFTIIITAKLSQTQVVASIDPIGILNIPLLLKIENTGPPVFSQSPKDLSIMVGKSQVLTFPSFSDPDPADTASATVDLGTAKAFITGKFPSFNVKPTSNAAHVGNHTVTVTLSDDNPNMKFTVYTFVVVVVAEPVKEVKNSTLTQKTADGLVVAVNPDAAVFKLPTKRSQVQKFTPLKVILKSVLDSGIAQINFNQPMLVPKNISWIDKTVLKIKVIPGRDSEAELLHITEWHLIDFKSTAIRLQLTFQNLLYISKNQVKDDLSLTFINPDFFISEISYEILKNNTLLTKQIPRQLAQDSATAMLQSAGAPAKNTMSTVMFGNMALNLVMAASLQMLWGMINVMQLIVHMPLLSVQFPSNAIFFYNMLIGIASFDVIPTQAIKEKLFNFSDEEQEDTQFSSMGYDSQSVVANLGSMLWYLAGFFGLVVFAMGIRFLRRKYAFIDKMYKYISNMIFFNMILRMFLEGFIEYAITSLVNLKKLEWQTSSDTFSSVLAILIFIAVLIFPFFLWALLWLRQGKLTDDISVTRFGSVYFEIKTNSRGALLYNVFYTGRRLLFALLAIAAEDFTFLQIQVMVFHCILLLVYLIRFQPFENPLLNKLEIFNECCIMGAAMHLFVFTEYAPDPQLQMKGGWSIVGLTTINIVVNMIVMVNATYQKLKVQMKKVMLRYERWRRQKARKYLASSTSVTEANLKLEDLNTVETDEATPKLVDIRRRRRLIVGEQRLDINVLSNRIALNLIKKSIPSPMQNLQLQQRDYKQTVLENSKPEQVETKKPVVRQLTVQDNYGLGVLNDYTNERRMTNDFSFQDSFENVRPRHQKSFIESTTTGEQSPSISQRVARRPNQNQKDSLQRANEELVKQMQRRIGDKLVLVKNRNRIISEETLLENQQK